MSRRRRNLTHVAIATIISGTLLYAALHEDHPATEHPDPPPTMNPAWPSVTVQPSPSIDTAALSWSDYLGARLPSSAVDGPLDSSGGLARGFTRTPRGALLAAVNIAIRANKEGGPRVFGPTIEHQVVGPDKQALLVATRYAYDYYRERDELTNGTPRPLGAGEGADGRHSGVTEEAPLAHLRIEAYRWQGYTPLEASLDLVTAKPGDDDLIYRAATHLQLRWQDGDWRVLAPPGGAWGSAAIRIESLDGYDRFTGGR
jgi:hypothetical protein